MPHIEGTMSSKTNQKKIAAWKAKIDAVYPEFWLENGGPIRTRRDSPANRHVDGRTPWGGYDLSITAEEAAAVAARPARPCPDCDGTGLRIGHFMVNNRRVQVYCECPAGKAAGRVT
jgi:hypothetical protein